jgi:hypothetical protein
MSLVPVDLQPGDDGVFIDVDELVIDLQLEQEVGRAFELLEVMEHLERLAAASLVAFDYDTGHCRVCCLVFPEDLLEWDYY